jgi:hypothetical protein
MQCNVYVAAQIMQNTTRFQIKTMNGCLFQSSFLNKTLKTTDSQQKDPTGSLIWPRHDATTHWLFACQKSLEPLAVSIKWEACVPKIAQMALHQFSRWICSLRPDNPSVKVVFSYASPVWTVHFFAEIKEGVKTYLLAPMPPLDSPVLFPLRRIYSLCMELAFRRVWHLSTKEVSDDLSLWRLIILQIIKIS